ncbi:WD repeat-containing protein jip5 [Saccharomyces pastorianus]|uniref:WD repeat-containing protein jip5 n=1 Tax=Saccharomyces pastorianus TaxID=27292 RepID=A0A6C1E1X5_SACPS|nr:WD repeat-containing protein jip5 [Saccharomyces pastorianus]
MITNLQRNVDRLKTLENYKISARFQPWRRVKQSDVVDSTNFPFRTNIFKTPIFQSILHPELPIIITGFGTGHIVCHRYNPAELQLGLNRRRKLDAAALDNDQRVSPKKKGTCLWKDNVDLSLETKIRHKVVYFSVETEDEEQQMEQSEALGVETLWKTRRHKGSVRAICFDAKGSCIFSIGTDNIFKKADTMTGKVIKKVNLSSLFESEKKKNDKFTKLCISQTHPFILIGDESGDVHVLNSNNLTLTNTVHSIHFGDSINDIFHFDKKSVYKFISLGQTTLAYFDVRDKDAKPNTAENQDGKIMVSDDQEDEVLCGCFVDPEEADTLLCGMGEGIVTVWKPNKNDLVDQMSRIKISKDESIDCIVPTLQDDNCVWCGCSNGNIYKLNAKLGKLLK